MKTIVMTGGTSGFGRIAAERLAGMPDTRVLLGVHSTGVEGMETLPLDLMKLEKVRSFASEVKDKIGVDAIDILILNAGVQLSGGTKTEDGYETTFAVNHLAHYLLLQLLLPKLAYGATIVITTSGTYDPAEKTIIPPPHHANARLLAYPESDPERDSDEDTAGGRAYSSSKLCNLLTARYLQNSEEAMKNKWSVIAYDPGPTPGTKLVRGRKAILRFAWSILGVPFLRPLIPSMNSMNESGRILADLAAGKVSIPEGRVYAAHRRGKIVYPELSELAARDDLMEALWRDSASLVELVDANKSRM